MVIERTVMIFAGTVILLSLALAMWVNLQWLLLTAFVGLNLIVSGLTGFCPLVKILEKAGMEHGCTFRKKATEESQS